MLVSAQHETKVRYYSHNQTTNCFQLHILLQNTSSITTLVDITVGGGLQGWGVSIEVEILCPIGFTQISGQCQEKYVGYQQLFNAVQPLKFLIRQQLVW